MFDIEQVQLLFNIDKDITDLKISNNVLYLSTLHVVYRIDLNYPEVVTEFKIVTTDNDQIEHMFIDPKGYHLLVKTKNLNYHYINRDFNQSKMLHKMKGFDINCVEFCFESTEDDYIRTGNSGSVLLGTSSGIIYELIIDVGSLNNDYFNTKLEKLLRQVFKSKDPIVGIQLKSTSRTTWNIIISTADNILIFEGYEVLTFHHKSSNFNQLHKGIPKVIKLSNKLSSHNSQIFCSVTTSDEVITLNSSNLRVNRFKVKEIESVRSILLTQFHIFILLETKLVTFNQLNSELVSEYELDPNELFFGLGFDVVERTFWLYSTANLFEILIENESKDIWQIMLSQGLYEEALNSLNDNDLNSRDLVMTKQAEDLYENGKIMESAEIFSKTSKSTEEVILLLKDDPESSLKYLTGKLTKLTKNQVMQKITLSSWIVELYMEILNSLDNQINSFNNTSILNNSQETNKIDDRTLSDLNSKQMGTSKEFISFLTHNLKSLHKQTVYQIINSHNRKEDLLNYANMIKDYDFVLNYYVNLGRWLDLLKILLLLFGKNESNLESLKYVYKYASVLMMNEPKGTIDTWMKIDNFVGIDFIKLLPAMSTYNKIVCNSLKPTDNEALNLLQYLIEQKNNKERAIHNTYLCLLASYPFGDGEAQILKYLEKNVGGGFNSSTPKEMLFDTDFILRLCNKYKKIKSLIYIHSISGDYEEAVDLALQNDLIELATVIADRPAKKLDYSFIEEENDKSNRLRKKLWLNIAQKLINEVLKNDKYLVQTGNEIVVGNEKGNPIDVNKKNSSIQRILRYVLDKANTDGYVKLITIQDLLALFPEFMVIDNFKEEIVNALEEYSASLEKLNDEMNQALKTSVKLKLEMKELERNRFLTVEPKESCSICNRLLVTRKFFTYPCFHSFHQDCLVGYYKSSKNYKVKNKLYILEKKLLNHKKLNDVEGVKEVKQEIDATLVEKCAYCDLKISEIDDSFAQDDAVDDDF